MKDRRFISNMFHYLDQLHKGRSGKLLTFLFYAAWTVELVAVIIDKSALINPYESWIFRLTFVVYVLLTLTDLDLYSRKEMLWILFFAVIGTIDYRASGRNMLLRAVFLVCACRGIDVRKALKYTLWFTVAGCLLLVVLSLCGILGAVSITQDYGHGLETRYTLGLGHPNALHCMACMLILLVLYLYGDAAGKWKRGRRAAFYGGLFIFNAVLFWLTKSNTGFLVTAAGILYLALLQLPIGKKRRNCPSDGRWGCLLGEAVLVLGLLYSVLGAVINPAGHPLWEAADRLMTGRVSSLWDTTFHEGTLSTWHWFGSRQNQAYFDMGFIRLIYWYGVIPAIVLIALIFVLLRRMRRSHAAGAFVMLLMCCIYTIPEAHLVSVYLGRNYCLLLAAAFLWKKGTSAASQ